MNRAARIVVIAIAVIGLLAIAAGMVASGSGALGFSPMWWRLAGTDREELALQYLDSLRPGTSRADVIATLGPPGEGVKDPLKDLDSFLVELAIEQGRQPVWTRDPTRDAWSGQLVSSTRVQMQQPLESQMLGRVDSWVVAEIGGQSAIGRLLRQPYRGGYSLSIGYDKSDRVIRASLSRDSAPIAVQK
jgi:hypothetical protein